VAAIVVVIEDNPTTADITSRLLYAVGFDEIYLTSTAEEGMALVQRVRPQLIIVDERLPDASGTELVRSIRTYDPTLTIAMSTVLDDAAVMHAAFEAGCNYYLVKSGGLRKLCQAYPTPDQIINPKAHEFFR
jgi:two-component system response regulator DctR